MTRQAGTRTVALAATAAPVLVIGGVALVAAAISIQSTRGACVDRATSLASRLDAEQLGNARVIDAIGQSMDVPQPGESIALATALQESGLHNLPGGDRDSVGLFQQRPSQGWGTPAELMQPAYAAHQFYAHLLAVPGWRGMSTTQAAQAVQHSAHPNAYAHWRLLADALVADLENASTCLPANGDAAGGDTAVAAGSYHIPPNTPAPITEVIHFALDQLGKPYLYGATGPAAWDCSSLVQAAYATIGIPLPRTTYEQVTVGTPVYDLDDLRPGDLLFTPGSDGTPASPGHVGMYLGDGTLIQAPHTGSHVELSPLSSWRGQISAARRVVG